MPLLLVVVLGLILFAVKWYQKDDTVKPKPKTTTTDKKATDPSSTINRNHGFDRRISYIEYTEHAKCRMQCRKISQAEVEEMMQEGKINYNKSNTKARPCPTYAVEGRTMDGQKVRIVFAQCDFKSKVVTVIDLDTDRTCHCPGDDDRSTGSRNKNKR
jgi:hypothetical protein